MKSALIEPVVMVMNVMQDIVSQKLMTRNAGKHLIFATPKNVAMVINVDREGHLIIAGRRLVSLHPMDFVQISTKAVDYLLRGIKNVA